MIENYCVKIGSDPLLVQGAGGNVSWKAGHILWIKASGTSLSKAKEQSIFVPIDLLHLEDALSHFDFDVKPRLVQPSSLRPSIETLLHALMPQKIVVHLHEIRTLSYLVRENIDIEIKNIMHPLDSFIWVDYCKPGANLAKLVFTQLQTNPDANIIFLQNHGIVIGADSLDEIDAILAFLIDKFDVRPLCEAVEFLHPIIPDELEDYFPIFDPALHQLVLNRSLLTRVESNWAICPDHVVFLGAKPYLYESMNSFNAFISQNAYKPELILIKNLGVFNRSSFNQSKEEQLRSYFDILIRQPLEQKIKTLNDHQINELINWESEQFRIQLSVDDITAIPHPRPKNF